MKVFVLLPNEDWFCDRFGDEYFRYSRHEVSTSTISTSTDIIWLLASWCWKDIPLNILLNKKVVCTIHHEVPEKFSHDRKQNFLFRDKFVDVYHVPCKKTKAFISNFTIKPIEVISYWCNNDLFKSYDKIEMKKRFNLPEDHFIVSSFQRDTEGSDLISPKLEKGPDIFVKYIEKLKKQGLKIHVLLNGWRRQYIINCLNNLKIGYSYFELPKMQEVVKMYSATDLYVVGSRVEGGPQSILECAITKTPIVSTDVGIASNVLNKNCIFDPFDSEKSFETYVPTNKDIEYAFNKVNDYLIEDQITKYDDFFDRIK